MIRLFNNFLIVSSYVSLVMHSDFLIRIQTEHVSLAGDPSLIYSAPGGLPRQEKDR